MAPITSITRFGAHVSLDPIATGVTLAQGHALIALWQLRLCGGPGHARSAARAVWGTAAPRVGIRARRRGRDARAV